jgi:glycosyltransferase involved in cell wall biosynthesis
VHVRTTCRQNDSLRILFVSTNLPIPATNGQAIRSLSMVQALASSGHELNFVSFAIRNRAECLDPLSSFCRAIDLIDRDQTNMSQHGDYFRRLGCLLSLKPYSIERFRSEAMRARIESHLRTQRFDLIVCDSLYALTNVPKTDIPIALNCHNVEYVILERYSRIETNLAKKCYARIEAQLMRRAERLSSQRAAIAMVCSSDDRDTLRHLNPNLSISVVPNSVDTDSYRPDETEASGNTGPVVLFQGSMDWYPNRDAVEFFARAILPEVRRESPGVRFIVAGRNPPTEMVAQLRGAVEFTGTVPDMRPYLSAATVVVVPLRLGSGTRIKILEACAAGKAVVSTSVGAEGLGLESNREIILADDPSEFARSLTALLRDPVRRAAMATLARAVVVERYSHLSLKRSLETVVSHLAPVCKNNAIV